MKINVKKVADQLTALLGERLEQLECITLKHLPIESGNHELLNAERIISPLFSKHEEEVRVEDGLVRTVRENAIGDLIHMLAGEYAKQGYTFGTVSKYGVDVTHIGKQFQFQAYCVVQWLGRLKKADQPEPDKYNSDDYWIDDDPAGWDEIRVGELFMLKFPTAAHRKGVVYRKCSNDKAQDSNGIAAFCEPSRDGYVTLKQKEKKSAGQNPDNVQILAAKALEGWPKSASSTCTAPLRLSAVGNNHEEIVLDLRQQFGDNDGVLQNLEVQMNKNRAEGGRTFYAVVDLAVPPAVAIKLRTKPWFKIESHQVNEINDHIEIFRVDAAGAGGACHDYIVMVGAMPMSNETYQRVLRDIQNRSYPLYNNGRVMLYALRYSEEEMTRYAMVAYNRDGEVHSLVYCNYATILSFQNGPTSGGVNGVTHEALIAILKDRLQGFQSGKFAGRENAMVLTKLDEAAHWLGARTQNRRSRGVEGTHSV